MLINNNPVSFNAKKIEKGIINVKTTEIKNESIKLSANNDNLKIGVSSKLSKNEDKIATPIKLYSETDKIKKQQSIASGLIGVAIAGSAFTLARPGFQIGSSFGIKGAIAGAIITGTTGALLAGATAGTFDDRIFSNMKAVGAGFALNHTLTHGNDLKTSAILIGAGALVGAGAAMGAAYAGGSNHKTLF